MFHRIIPKFMVQGGDPTGTGSGGESVYGETFKDEIHSRLRFSVRGLVAMANGGRNDNGSQFFMTLAPCEWLNGKHTIFGKVTGKTIFNLDAMGASECDQDDRPLYPPRILSTEVLLNPFDDIIPREVAPKQQEEEKPKIKVKKNKSLLSFADDEEAPGLEEESTTLPIKKKMVSAHDVLEDARLVKESDEVGLERSVEDKRRDEMEVRKAAGGNDDADEDEYSSSDDEKSKKKSAGEKRVERFVAVKETKLKKLQDQTKQEENIDMPDDFDEREKEREARILEMERLKKEILNMKKGTRAVKLGDQAIDKDAELLSTHEQKRAQLKRKKQTGKHRQFDTMEKLQAFRENVGKTLFGDVMGIAKQKQLAKAEREREREREKEKEAEREREKEQQKQELVRTEVGAIGWQEALDDYDDSDWLGGNGLKFAKESKVSFLQREMENDDSLATYDPLKDQRPKDAKRQRRYDPLNPLQDEM
uniref:PPIase cyclophilin-type domain-containing protein n=2 Tax=Guillardia theta TaxID=55529 RepID=A0A7S4UWM0_GUITH